MALKKKMAPRATDSPEVTYDIDMPRGAEYTSQVMLDACQAIGSGNCPSGRVWGEHAEMGLGGWGTFLPCRPVRMSKRKANRVNRGKRTWQVYENKEK